MSRILQPGAWEDLREERPGVIEALEDLEAAVVAKDAEWWIARLRNTAADVILTELARAAKKRGGDEDDDDF